MAKKSNTAAKVAISIIALGLVAGALGAATRGFRNWDPETWFNYWGQGEPEESDPIESEPGDEEIGGTDVNVLLRGGRSFASKSSVGDTKEVIATLLASDGETPVDDSTPNNIAPSDDRILWESSDPSKVSVAESITHSGEANQLQLKSLFSGEVEITVKPLLASPSTATTFTVDYQSLVKSLQIVGWYTPDALENPFADWSNTSSGAYEQYKSEVGNKFKQDYNQAMYWVEQGDYSSVMEATSGSAKISNQAMVGGDSLENPLHFYDQEGNFRQATLFHHDIAYVLVKGTAAEGAEDLDLGAMTPEISLGGVPYEDPAFPTKLPLKQGEDPTEVYGCFMIEGLLAADKTVQYLYTVGDATVGLNLTRFVSAGGVQTDSESVHF